MGQPGYELSATAFADNPTGFAAIAVALLGRTTAVGVLLASLFFGGLRSGSTTMQAVAHVDPNLVLIIEALLLFFIAAEFLPVVQRTMPNWLGGSRKQALVPAMAGGLTSAELPENGKSVKQDGVEVSDLAKEE